MKLQASMALAGAVFTISSTSSAAGLNDPSCVPSAARPYPAIVVHGQAGNFEGMTAITDSLVQAGYCVYARNYGHVPGGANGQDHLSVSAGQIGDFIDQVLAQTGASKVDVVGHSAGTGVLDNYVLKRGGAAKVHRQISFGGLHHPYAHAGAPNFVDMDVFLPNLTLAARFFYPGFSVQQVATAALNTYAAAGSPLGMVDPALVATIESNFTADLFDPDYWRDLHGSMSENQWTLVTVGNGTRSLRTHDAAPNVCYTNIVAIADLLAGGEAGFQDAASNVDNYLLLSSVTTNAHVDMISDPIALDKMISGLNTPCDGTSAPAAVENPSAVNPEANQRATQAFSAAIGFDQGTAAPSTDASSGGCSVSHSQGSGTGGAFAAIGLALAAIVRRRRIAQ